MTAFGAIALVLAAVGIYTVMAYYVSQRRHEMGVRMALGGRARDMILLTLGHAARMSGLGIAIGLGLGILLARVLENALFGIIALEPWLIVAMGVLLGVISATASIIPARNAARIDPARRSDSEHGCEVLTVRRCSAARNELTVAHCHHSK